MKTFIFILSCAFSISSSVSIGITKNGSIGEFCEERLANTKPISIADLEQYIKDNTKNGELDKEYKKVPDGQLFLSKEGAKMKNIPKNRYKTKYLAYDHSRVQLGPTCDDEEGHYINANHMHGVNRDNRYIATQGPLTNTFNDFWKMVWDNDVLQIVMLTKILDHGKIKCHKYWPEDTKRYGAIQVTLENVDYLSDYVVRTMLLKHKGEVRRIIQYHYVAWPDFGVPEYPESILNLMTNVRNSKRFQPDARPLLVHCAGGMGRTGTYILIDSLLDQALEEQVVDPAKQLCKMRQRRINVVETAPQYTFAHKVLNSAIKQYSTV